MRERRTYLLISGVALIVMATWIFLRGDAEPLVSGKPVAYWLDTFPIENFDGLMPPDHPLAKAGPETVPSLVAAINRSYGSRRLLRRYEAVVTPLLGSHAPKQRVAGWQIRMVAAFRLGLMGPEAEEAVPTLVEMLQKPSPGAFYKGRVIQALGSIGPPAETAVPILVENLDEQNEWVRMTAAQSLLQIGTVPDEAVPALEQNLEDSGPVTALMAVALLAAQDTPRNLGRVQAMLAEEGDGNTRPHVAAALGYLREVPPGLKPALTRMLSEDDASVQQGAAIGLAGPQAENLGNIMDVLVEGLKQGQFQVRCAQALGKIGPDASIARPELEQAEGYVLEAVAREALNRISADSTGSGQGARRGEITTDNH